jgi:hypothetical protein
MIKGEGKTDELSKANRASGMVDYEQFKQAIVYISGMAQEKLGGYSEDLLKAKLEKEKKNNQLLDE